MYGHIEVKFSLARGSYSLLQLSPMQSYTRIKDNLTGQSKAGVRLPDFNNSVSWALCGFNSTMFL